MLAAVVFISRAATGRGVTTNEELLHKEMAASLLAAFLCALFVYPCLLAKMNWTDALGVAAGFSLEPPR